MRCNILLVPVFAAVSAPTLAAPLNFADDSLVARDTLLSDFEARELANFAARDYADEDESGSLSLPPGTVMRGPPQSAPSTVSIPRFPFPMAYKVPIFDKLPNIISAPPLQTRSSDDNESGASIFSDIIRGLTRGIGSTIVNGGSNNRRDLDGVYELLARAAEEDDESGASILSTIARAAEILLRGRSDSSPPQQQPARRDVEAVYELLSRTIEDDESGAMFRLPQFNGELALSVPLFGGSRAQLPRRDVDSAIYELFARAAEDDESGAGFLDFLKNIF